MFFSCFISVQNIVGLLRHPNHLRFTG
jgi:hypothetical protein